LREHGYEGALDAEAEVAVLPVADAVGPSHDGLLLELARRSITVVRPAPDTPMAQHAQEHLVFLGVRGQLDPGRGQSAVRRVVGVAMLAMGLVVRRAQGRPVLWARSATLRERRSGDPAERVLALGLRLSARQVETDRVPNLVDTVGSGTP
jgi:hypothetical protein